MRDDERVGVGVGEGRRERGRGRERTMAEDCVLARMWIVLSVGNRS
jgi:hypothetical protein